jgi:growth factor-regulated tyrosine kinase substrate
MLEERLSNTYNQHSIGGYNLPAQRAPAASGIYPTISSNPLTGAGGNAENFYTGNVQQESYGRPQSTYYGPTQQQYSVPNKRASISGSGYQTKDRGETYNQYPASSSQQAPPTTGNWQIRDPSSTPTPANTGYTGPEPRVDGYNQQSRPVQPPRTGSWPTTEAAPAQHQSQPSNYLGENVSQQVSPPSNVPSQPPTNYAPSEPALTPSADSNTPFYYNNTSQGPLQQNSEQTQSSYPPTQSPQLYHSSLTNPAPTQQFVHQSNKQPSQSVQSNQVQPPYWQSQQQNQALQQTWQAPAPTYSGYTQESFPAAPHHAPQQKVEESLIEF